MADDGGSNQYDEINFRVLKKLHADATKAHQDMKKAGDDMHRSGNWASQIGLFFLKMLLVLNGGALIALMGIYSDIAPTKEISSELTRAGEFFLSGLMLAGSSVMFTYMHQVIFATDIAYSKLHEALSKSNQVQSKLHEMEPDLHEMPENYETKNPKLRSFIARWGSQIIFVVCTVSFGLFSWGSQSVLNALEQLPVSTATDSSMREELPEMRPFQYPSTPPCP